MSQGDTVGDPKRSVRGEFGPAATAAAATADASLTVSTLPNGVRVVTDAMPGVASASVGVWIGAGARHETAAENGVAHFLEHMAFKGTTSRTARQIAEEIEDGGGYFNAYTSREATAYYARVLADETAGALDVVADILTEPLFAPSDVEVERGVIMQEIGQTRDTPDDVIFDWAQELAYPEQAYGRPILGDETTVGAFQPEAFRGFMDRTYTPDRIVLAGAGGVSHDALTAFAETAFGGRRASALGPAEPARYVGGELRREKALEQAHVVLGFDAPSLQDPAFYAAQVYAVLIGGGMSSRLFQEVRENRGLCYAIGAQPSHGTDAGALTIYAGTGGDQVRELLEVTADILREAATSLSDAEISRAKAQLKADILMKLESSSARCERAARSLLLLGRVAPIVEVVERLEAVDRAALSDYAERLIGGPRPTLALYGPVARAPSLDEICNRLAA